MFSSEGEKLTDCCHYAGTRYKTPFAWLAWKMRILPSRFYELQYLFCPAKFEMHGDDDWGEEVVIPICEKNPIKKGGTAELWQISVPEEFVGPSLRNIASGSRFDNKPGSGKEPDWVCALIAYLP